MRISMTSRSGITFKHTYMFNLFSTTQSLMQSINNEFHLNGVINNGADSTNPHRHTSIHHKSLFTYVLCLCVFFGGGLRVLRN